MKRTILYYPNIAIENPQWLRQSVLYWDEVGSIVPRRQVEKTLNIRGIRELYENGVYRPFTPDHYVSKNHAVAKEFMSYIPFFTKVTAGIKAKTSLIYESKILPDLADLLIDRDFAQRFQNQLLMDERLSMLYMSLLAKHMSNDDETALTIPGTDLPAYLDLLFPKTQRGIPGLNLTLRDILPVPTEAVSISKILRFKEKYKDELFKLRAVLYEHQDNLKKATEKSEVLDLSGRFVEFIQVELSSLGKALHGDRLEFRLGTLSNLFALATPSLVANAIQGLPDQTKLTISVAGTIFSGAVIMGQHFVSAHNKKQERLRSNSFSYLYLAKQKGIIK